MSTQTTLPDEANAPGQEWDAEGFDFLGTGTAVHAAAQASGQNSATLPDKLNYADGGAHLGYAMQLAGAVGQAYLAEHAPYKYADDTVDPLLSFAPEPGMEQHIAEMNGQAYQPYQTKEPRFNVANQPSTYSLVTNQASRGPDVLASSDDAMLALRYEF